MSDIQTVRMVRTEDGKTGDIHPEEVENMRAFGWIVDEAVPADAKIELGTDSGDQFSDEQLRAAIETATGKAPHHKTGRDKLIAQFNELNAQEAGNGRT